MGRGRQKAKQMKVARRLKYFSPDTDLGALQRELSGDSDNADVEYGEDEDSDDYSSWREDESDSEES